MAERKKRINPTKKPRVRRQADALRSRCCNVYFLGLAQYRMTLYNSYTGSINGTQDPRSWEAKFPKGLLVHKGASAGGRTMIW